ncbi:hypothetical protein [Catenovulum sediminis]|uniref:Transposase n=1 Tax=Catenovulum sediminis TaxID=1740262 RepID=A0ABV1RHA4_9ALTE
MNVIDFKHQVRLTPKKAFHACMHSAVFVVEHSRNLECRKCGKVIDPFDFLLKEAQKQQNTIFDIRGLISEKEKLSQEVEGLKSEKRNIQAQIRRLKK